MLSGHNHRHFPEHAGHVDNFGTYIRCSAQTGSDSDNPRVVENGRIRKSGAEVGVHAQRALGEAAHLRRTSPVVEVRDQYDLPASGDCSIA